MDKHSPRLSKNAAPHSGRIMWARCLLERINGTSPLPLHLPLLMPAT